METEPAIQADVVEALRAALATARIEVAQALAEASAALAQLADRDTLIAHQKLMIEKLRREKFGPSSERTARLLDQLELDLAEMEAAATEDELAAEFAARTTQVTSFVRKKPARRAFPEHLPRERVVIAGPTSYTCCGGTRLAKLGEDVT